MFRTALTAAALAALFAAGAQAQTAPGTEPATPPATPPAATAPMTPGAMPEHDGMAGDAAWTATALGAVSTDKLKGADLVNVQGEKVATIDDVLITNDNAVEGIVVTFGGVLGFGAQKVLLAPDEVEVMEDADKNLQVRTSLTPEAIEARPAYEES